LFIFYKGEYDNHSHCNGVWHQAFLPLKADKSVDITLSGCSNRGNTKIKLIA